MIHRTRAIFLNSYFRYTSFCNANVKKKKESNIISKLLSPKLESSRERIESWRLGVSSSVSWYLHAIVRPREMSGSGDSTDKGGHRFPGKFIRVNKHAGDHDTALVAQKRVSRDEISRCSSS